MRWKILSKYGIPDKYIRVTKLLFKDYTSRVSHEVWLSHAVKVERGVKQECVLCSVTSVIPDCYGLGFAEYSY